MSRAVADKRDALERLSDFEEVRIGLPLSDALSEAARCLECSDPGCVKGCPLGIDIPGFIRCIKEKDIANANSIIIEKNPFPSICSRLCPNERLCEKGCILAKEDEAIAIADLERFAAENKDNIFIIPDNISPKKEQNQTVKNGKKAAVVGSGPSGMSCAVALLKRGFEVDIYEAMHESGGSLRFAIPGFRMPKSVLDMEIERIKALGAKFILNHVVGRTIDVESLQKSYDASYLATGASSSGLPSLPGTSVIGVQTASEYLTRVYLGLSGAKDGRATPINSYTRLVVVGDDNCALDCARVARRLGSNVTIVFRESYDDISANGEEFDNAREEGVRFFPMTEAVRVIGGQKVSGIELRQTMPDIRHDGSQTYASMENTEFVVPCDQVIFSEGSKPNPVISKTVQIQHRMDGSIITDMMNRTSMKGVFAGGGLTGGMPIAARSIRDGIIAAETIDLMLNGTDESK